MNFCGGEHQELNLTWFIKRFGSCAWPFGIRSPKFCNHERCIEKPAPRRTVEVGRARAAQLIMWLADEAMPDWMAIPDNETKSSVVSPASRVEGLDRAAIVSNMVHEFEIIACTADGTRREVGGDPFFVAIRGGDRVRARITDRDDGTYLVSWRPLLSGDYSVAISIDGAPLFGSPFRVRVHDPSPHAARCEVSGGALNHITARTSSTFEIRYRDRCGQVAPAVELDVFLVPLDTQREAADLAAAGSGTEQSTCDHSASGSGQQLEPSSFMLDRLLEETSGSLDPKSGGQEVLAAWELATRVDATGGEVVGKSDAKSGGEKEKVRRSEVRGKRYQVHPHPHPHPSTLTLTLTLHPHPSPSPFTQMSPPGQGGGKKDGVARPKALKLKNKSKPGNSKGSGSGSSRDSHRGGGGSNRGNGKLKTSAGVPMATIEESDAELAAITDALVAEGAGSGKCSVFSVQCSVLRVEG